jgi:hypothetical protein
VWPDHAIRRQPVPELESEDGSLGARAKNAIHRPRPLIGRPQTALNSANLGGTARLAISRASAHGLGPLGTQRSLRLRSRDAVDRKPGRDLESLHGSLGQRAIEPVDRTRLMTERAEPLLQQPHTRGSIGSPIARSQGQRRLGDLVCFRCLGDRRAGVGRAHQAQQEERYE